MRYELLKYLFYDTPNLHPLPSFQSDLKFYTTNNSWYLINTLFFKKNRYRAGFEKIKKNEIKEGGVN